MVCIPEEDQTAPDFQLGWYRFVFQWCSFRSPVVRSWDDNCGAIFFGGFRQCCHAAEEGGEVNVPGVVITIWSLVFKAGVRVI